jgi:hypothetical protein
MASDVRPGSTVSGRAATVDRIVGASIGSLCLPAASSGTHDKLRLTLRLTGLLVGSGRIFGTTEVAHGKPAPDLFLRRIAWVTPRRCLVVETAGQGRWAPRWDAITGYAGGLTARLARRAGHRRLR